MYKNCFLFWHSKQFLYTTCSKLLFFLYWCQFSMNNLLSCYGLIDSRMSASEKDLPVLKFVFCLNKILMEKMPHSFWIKFGLSGHSVGCCLRLIVNAKHGILPENSRQMAQRKQIRMFAILQGMQAKKADGRFLHYRTLIWIVILYKINEKIYLIVL